MSIDINVDCLNNINNIVTKNITMSFDKYQKMVFLYNCLHDGWCVKKQNDSFTFTKKHEQKREVLKEKYLI